MRIKHTGTVLAAVALAPLVAWADTGSTCDNLLGQRCLVIAAPEVVRAIAAAASSVISSAAMRGG